MLSLGLIVTTAWLGFASPAGAVETPDSLRAAVVAYAEANIGKPVGGGECTSLANFALKAAGAMSRRRKEYPNRGDYIWGKEILLIEGAPGRSKMTGNIADVRPGDIAQFRDATFPHAQFSHHTAVIFSVTPEKLGLLQQNYRGERFVTRGTFRIDRLSEGWIRIYRPLPQKRSE